MVFLRSTSSYNKKATGKTEGVIEEMVNGQKVIKVFNHQAEAEEAFNRANDELFEASNTANRYSNILIAGIK